MKPPQITGKPRKRAAPVLDGSLANARHELFARGLASGMSGREAHIAAGYRYDAGNCSHLAQKPAIIARVAELIHARAKGEGLKRPQTRAVKVNFPLPLRALAADRAAAAGLTLSAFVLECVRAQTAGDPLRRLVEEAAAGAIEEALRRRDTAARGQAAAPARPLRR